MVSPRSLSIEPLAASPPMAHDNLDSYMDICRVALGMCLAGLFFNHTLPDHKPSRSHRDRGRYYVPRSFYSAILMCAATSSVWLQIGSVFTCRPWEILHDLRHTSMLAVQLFAFVICSFSSFGLGVMCVLFDSADRQRAYSGAHVQR